MPIFRSREADNIDAVAARLASARADLAVISGEIRTRSVELVLLDDASTLGELRRREAAARDHVALCEVAHRQAVARENQRLAEVRVRARKSEYRAYQQHSAALMRAVDNYTRIAADLQAAWLQIEDASGRALKLLPPMAYKDFPELYVPRLRDAGERELARLGRRGWQWALEGESAPGSRAYPLTRMPTELRPWADEMKDTLARYSAQFRDHLALPITSAPAGAPEPEEPAENLVDVTMAEPSDLAAAAIAIGAPVSVAVPAEDAPPTPHPPGSAEEAEYLEAEAAISRASRRPIAPVE